MRIIFLSMKILDMHTQSELQHADLAGYILLIYLLLQFHQKQLVFQILMLEMKEVALDIIMTFSVLFTMAPIQLT